MNQMGYGARKTQLIGEIIGMQRMFKLMTETFDISYEDDFSVMDEEIENIK